jgi:MscS family membrane protein
MFDVRRRHTLSVVVCAWLLGICTPLTAQAPRAPAPADSPPPAADPLGRDSPFGTITGFSGAVHRNDVAVATRYLQRERRSTQQLEDLAGDLSDLLDRYFTGRLSVLSMAPTGDLADGLDPDREAIRLDIGDRSVDLFLRRVKDPTAGMIWLVSSESLARVPTLHRSEAATWIERVMPASLVSRSYYGLSLAQWTLWASTLLAPLLLFGTFAWLVLWVAKRRIGDVRSRTRFLSSWDRVLWPLVLTLTLISHLAMIPLLGFSVRFRVAYTRIVLFASVLVAAMLIWRLVTVTSERARLAAIHRGRSNTRSLIQLGERVVKVLVVLVALFVLLALGGVDPTTALAGVGIVGVAVALGAQKSVENLLGAVFLLTDRVLAVGDFCRVSDRDGWIEDITLRSVRLRTLDQTLLSVPAGLLSQGSIENYTTRGKILLQTVLRLRYGTTCEQLHVVLEDVRQLLAQHPAIEKEGARARLTSFGAQAIEIEMFAYVMTADYAAFLEIRESLLLQIAHIIESSGSAFAIPTQFIYMRSEADENRQLLAHHS